MFTGDISRDIGDGMKMKTNKSLKEDSLLLNLQVKDRDDAIRKVSKFLSSRVKDINADFLAEELIRRENEGPPIATKKGFTVLHLRVKGLDEIYGVAVRLAKGVDFGEPNGNLTRLVFMFVNSLERNEDYLRLLSRISRLLSKDKVSDKLFNARTKEEFFNALAEYDI